MTYTEQEGPLPVTVWPNESRDWRYTVSSTVGGARVSVKGDDIRQVFADFAQMSALAGGVNAQQSPPAPPQVGVPQAGPPAQAWNHAAPVAPVAPVAPQGWGAPPVAAPGAQAPWEPQGPPQAAVQQTGAPCDHGVPRVWVEGIGKKSGKPYKGWFCKSVPMAQQCPPIYVGQ